jgi:ribonuclease P/MRP protein subunit RPP1
MRTDARTYIDGDTSAERMALEAGALGYDAIVAVGAMGSVPGRVRVIPGASISASSVNRVMAEVRKAPREAFVTVQLGEPGFNRGVAALSGIHALAGIHRCRRNSFDHVAARTVAERHVGLEISLAPLVADRGPIRQSALRRYADLLVLHDRYGFPLVLGSGARSCLALRAPRAAAALCRLFGLDEDGVEAAFSAVEALMSPPSSVRVVE